MADPDIECVGGELGAFEPVLDEGFAEYSAGIDDVVEVGGADDEVLGEQGVGAFDGHLELGDGAGGSAPGADATVAPGLLLNPSQSVLAVGNVPMEGEVLAF
ncbi:MAG: hypothetical protein RI897_2608 [Verrucomicrobiota bacterium]